MSKLTLEKNIASWVINHLVKHGDTDILPHAFELKFFHDCIDDLSEASSAVNLYTYKPVTILHALAPKSRYGFRICHQIHPIDNIFFLGSVFHIANKLEESRPNASEISSYSYRFLPSDDYDLFKPENKYRSWLGAQSLQVGFGDDVKCVAVTDISDFYQRLGHHRIENCLNDYSGDDKYAKIPYRFLNHWRAKQSFGLPVGGNAARLIAEVCLRDIEQALINEGYNFTRYVDDFVIFVKNSQDPYGALAFLADHLAAEGLSLNNMKTRVLSAEEYRDTLSEESGEDEEQAEESAITRLFWQAYESEEDDETVLANLQALNLSNELIKEVEKDYWDINKIKIIFRGLRITKSEEAVIFVKDNFENLLPFAKEIVLFIDEMKKSGSTQFDDFGSTVVESLNGSVARNLSVVRAWLLELFVRGSIPINAEELSAIEEVNSTIDNRQFHLIRGKLSDRSYFRRNKDRVDELNSWEKTSFLFGAKCLPVDEFKKWTDFVKNNLEFTFSKEFVEWLQKNGKSS